MFPPTPAPTIAAAMQAYLQLKRLARSAGTALAYAAALRRFSLVLNTHGLDPLTAPLAALTVEALGWLIEALAANAIATEALYVSVVHDFFGYLEAEGLCAINLAKARQLIHYRARRPPQRLPQFPHTDIESLLRYALTLADQPTETEQQRLINLRDRAFLIVLADTGLRVHEACTLRRGALDLNTGQAVVIGKGNKQAVVRFSQRALRVVQDYLRARAALDGRSGRLLRDLPIFARHDDGSGPYLRAITTTTGRHIVARRVLEGLPEPPITPITPHSLRHYFVTKALRATNNLKLAQRLARHENIAITQRYAHLSDAELEAGYDRAFNQ